jgi:hypothetical protein
VENPGVICSPVAGNGIRGLRGMMSNAAEVALTPALGDGDGDILGGNNPGKIREMTEDKHATMNDTTAAWTCSRVRLPRMIVRRVVGSPSSPTFAAVPRRAERFISRLPLRLRTAGMTIMSWCT